MSTNPLLLSPPTRPTTLPSSPSFRRARSSSNGPPLASSSGAAAASLAEAVGAGGGAGAGAGLGLGGLSATTGGASTSTSTSTTSATRRPRSSSVVSVQEVPINYDDSLDQSALTNVNADWVNYKGAWLIHVVGILIGIVILDIIPGTTPDLIWTIVNLGYLSISYIMFHYVQGVPFDMNNSGAYDRLTLWEQIDSGAQYTPAKKWLTTLPIALFLVSTHYTRYDSHPAFFTLNLVSLILVGLAPKLPMFHRLRFRFFDGGVTPEPSAPATPIEDSIVAGERSFGTFR